MHSYGLLSPGFNKKGPRGGDVQVGHSNTYMHAFMYHFAFIMGFHACMHFFDFRPSRKRSLTAGDLKENLIEEIKELYKEINPGKKDVPELLAYYEGHELDLYKRICEKYNVEPKKRFGSILSRRSRRRSRSESPALPMASKPNAPAPPDADAGAGGGKAHAEPEGGKAGAEPEGGKAGAEPEGGKAAGAELEGGKAADASKVSASRPVSPEMPPKRNAGIIPAFRPAAQTGRYWPCPPPHKFLAPTPKVPKNTGFKGAVLPPPPKPVAAPAPWWPPLPPPPVAAKPLGTTALPARPPAKKERPSKAPQARIIHAFMHSCMPYMSYIKVMHK